MTDTPSDATLSGRQFSGRFVFVYPSIRHPGACLRFKFKLLTWREMTAFAGRRHPSRPVSWLVDYKTRLSMGSFLNQSTLHAAKASLPPDGHAFWQGIDDPLTPAGFRTLLDEYPSLEHFEKHEGLPRGNGQRPHDRYYLGYKVSRYHPPGYRGPGIVFPEDLPASWRRFLEEIEGRDYREFLSDILETNKFSLRCAWHMGMSGAEVSPHRDTMRKLSIHLFYFNAPEVWRADWGGDLLILKDCRVDRENPDFNDFREVIPVSAVGNRSALCRNGLDAWHGVKPLDCPEGQYRRLFTVIAMVPDGVKRKLLLRARRLFGVGSESEA
ncbi:hypothetical protein [Gymnodinialimonas ceratoperidinii]|uniref:2OG-Fe(II) oxygenase n=1 Tax=Gymnodinialimonas ceratoperidinii TaxID=2856823 RepID=A0A8F6YCL0_9RHOB|nr:hypothetical protein [Gymnodinialimonas ceratoperidinii]QXT39445.1 hypothetical protein KYE46_16220 [Gymnodinialimonas ceratoperidinii]